MIVHIGDKFIHKELNSLWMLVTYDYFSYQFHMEREDGKEWLTISSESFDSIFRIFGEYDEKDLVPCL